MTSRIEAIAARLAAATPGPWIYENGSVIHGFDDADTHYVTDQVGAADDDPPIGSFMFRADAELAAHAPDDLAWLVQEHHRLQSRVAYLEGWKTQAEEARDADPT
ncbi:hypothetical protein [Glycomyces tenuis]|uniref:hypothetical protein n=1 Tax=Glycomyces tenuis TaxID=58116 RepID=UPI0003F8E592|nr:hypothetical protein [Glycomyces tenuis]